MPNSLTSQPRILVFDSGVGGLSIFSELQQKLPNATYYYASDNAAFPYGTKSENDLIARVDAVLHKITDRFATDLIVVACNTASTLTLPHVRQKFTQPIVGVVPAIKPAAALTQSQVIGLLATPATVARAYTQQLIDDYAPNTKVISLGSRELVEAAEQKLRGEILDPNLIAQVLAPFHQHPLYEQMDVLVLACTHFPLLKEEIAQHFSSKVRIIDSGEAIARRVASLVEGLRCSHHEMSFGENIAIFTADTRNLNHLSPHLRSLGFSSTHILEV